MSKEEVLLNYIKDKYLSSKQFTLEDVIELSDTRYFLDGYTVLTEEALNKIFKVCPNQYKLICPLIDLNKMDTTFYDYYPKAIEYLDENYNIYILYNTMNEILQNPKDVKIKQMQYIIDSFKKYDEERKQYYANALIELGQAKEYIAELEDTSQLFQKIEALKKKNKIQEDKLSRLKYLEKESSLIDLPIETLELRHTLTEVNDKNKEILSNLKSRKEKYDKLLEDYIKLYNEFEQYKNEICKAKSRTTETR